MEAAEFETDALLKLLTDAIRRGPGSPEWHEAVSRLRNSGAQTSDEYRLLMDVRDRLESGKTYRQVRAGPEFTRAVFENLDEPVARKKPIVTFAVSFISLIVLVGAVAMLLKIMSNSTVTDPSLQRLVGKIFTTIDKDWTFYSESLPADLKPGGKLRISPALRIDADPNSNTNQMAGITTPIINLQSGMCVEAKLSYRPGLNNRVIVQLGNNEAQASLLQFVLDENGFDINNNGIHQPIKKSLPGGEYIIRIKADQNVAVIEVDGQIIWSGNHSMGANVSSSIYFIRTGETTGDIRVQSLRILTP